MFKDRIKKWLGLESRASFYIALSLVLLFYIAGFVYMSMFACSYENDVNVDFVVFTIEHCFAVFLVIMILPYFMCGLFIIWLEKYPYLTFEQEDEIYCFAAAGSFLYLVIIGIFFIYTTNKDDYITKEQRGIIVDLVKQEKISRNSVKATREIKIDADAYIGRKPLELEVCFKKGFHNPICAKLFENFLVREKEKVKYEKESEYLAEQNKQKAIENFNRIIEKVK